MPAYLFLNKPEVAWSPSSFKVIVTANGIARLDRIRHSINTVVDCWLWKQLSASIQFDYKSK